MGYRLFCGQNPKELGIEDKNGNWYLEALSKHVKICRECQKGLIEMLFPCVSIKSEKDKISKKKFNYSHICRKCGYEWKSNLKNPRTCPRCKSYKWREE